MSASSHLDPHIRTAVAEVNTDSEGAMRRYYAIYRNLFVWWAQSRFDYSEADFKDAFQEAMIVFWEKAQTRNLDKFDCLLKTFLFATGYRNLLQKNPAKSRLIFPGQLPDPPDFDRILSELEEDEKGQTLALLQLMEAFDRLGEVCRRLLRLYFFEKRRVSEITGIFGYANENVTSVNKFRCLKRLRELFDE